MKHKGMFLLKFDVTYEKQAFAHWNKFLSYDIMEKVCDFSFRRKY